MTYIQGLLEEVKTFHDIQLQTNVINSRQCKNLSANIQNGVKAIQIMSKGAYGVDVFHQVEQEMLGIMKEARYMIGEYCNNGDWYRAGVKQVNNKETFRELLLDFKYCFQAMCDIFRHSFPNREGEIQDIEKSTTFYPAPIDDVEQDQKEIFERASSQKDNCKGDSTFLQYLMERLEGLQKVAGGELDSILLPDTCPSVDYGKTPKCLGAGGFGNVYATQWMGLDTATKVIEVRSLEHERIVRKEASILAGLNHPNIINFFCCALQCDSHAKGSKSFVIVMERGDMSLSKFLEEKNEPLEEKMAVDIMIQIASAMCYLHDMKVAHRDLKPDNVTLISKGGSKLEDVRVKVLDFGISKIEVKDFAQVPTGEAVYGTRGYMAPEAHSKRSSEVDAFKLDVFSFGTICYEILSNKKASIATKVRDYVKDIMENEKQDLLGTCSEDLKSLIYKCRSLKPIDRPTFREIIKTLRKIKSDGMVKVASDGGVAKILKDSTTPNNSIECSKQRWTMVIEKLCGFYVWPICLLWQMLITFFQWLPQYLPYSSEVHTISSSSAREISNITTSKPIPCEVNIEAPQISKLIGLKGKILKLEKLLHDLGSLGIVGMGGIGKSTLANALSDHISHHFDATCYVGNFTYENCTIRMKYKSQDTKEIVETKALGEAHGFLEEKRKTKTILLVLDDVRDARQLEALLGYRTSQEVSVCKVIATSRKWESLKLYVHPNGRVDMETFDDKESKELFSINAFGSNHPCLPYLEHVVERIVKACDGLPLSLEVMGRYLYGETSLRIWERSLQRLLRARHDGSIDGKIWKTLRISFDELNVQEKNMFLDLTCFFSKDSWTSDWFYTKATLLRIFCKNDGTNVTKETLESLEDKSLIKFHKYGDLSIHDQLRDMGRMIAEKEFKDTRFWNSSLATFSKYCNDKDIELVEGLSFTTFEANHFPIQSIQKVSSLKNLRLLSVDNCGDIDIMLGIISKTATLKWLRIHLSNPTNEFSMQQEFFTIGVQEHLQHLCVLEMFNVQFCTPIIFENFHPMFLKEISFVDCKFLYKEFLLGFENIGLEELILHDCKTLQQLPKDFIKFTSLIKLNISKCTKLKEIPTGICNLEALEELSFNGCKSLKSVPEGFGGLICLKKLDMGDCKALEDFPSGICSLEALEELSFNGCKSSKSVPEGFGGLICLKKLYMWDCEALEDFPSGLCSLEALKELLFYGCKSLKSVPEGFRGLTCLKKLYMGNCEALEDFPSGICSLEALEELSFGGCKSLKSVPEGFGGLTCLKKLDMWDCEALEDFPSGICRLQALEELSFGGCKSLKSVPEGFGGLTCLKKLYMGDCEALEDFPTGICSLEALEELSFDRCKSLKSAPEGFGGLTCLKKLYMWDCEALEDFPSGICSLEALEELSFDRCKSLKSVPEGFGGLTCLKKLYMDDCEALEDFPSGICSLEALEELSFCGCKSLKSAPEGFGGLTCLKKLYMGNCEALEDFPSGICSLEALEELSFCGCKSLKLVPEGFGGLICLKKLNMGDCEALEDFPSGICSLEALEELSFYGCKSLKSVPEGFGGLICLKKLYMWNCEALEDFPSGICRLEALEELLFCGCKSLKSVPEGFGGLTCLKKLDMWDCEALEDFPSGMWTLEALEELFFYGCKSLKSVSEGFGGLTCLKKLYMWDCEALEDFPSGICRLEALEELSFRGCKSLKSGPEGFRGLTCLKKLYMGDCEALENFPSGICSLEALEELSFGGCKSLKSVPKGFGGLTCLKKLYMWDCEVLEDFPSGMWTLEALEELLFYGCKSLKSIPEGFGGLTCLKKLYMGDCEALEDFPSGICSLEALEELSFYGCKSLKSVPEGFGGLTCLKKLFMDDCEALEDFPSGICSLKALEELSFGGCKSLKSIPEGFGGLTCLKKLYMGDCEALEDFPSGICRLEALEELSFRGCKSLKSVPEGFGGLTCLKKLYMSDCEALEDFPSGICSLEALEELSFRGCKSLKSVPEGLGGLSLKILEI